MKTSLIIIFSCLGFLGCAQEQTPAQEKVATETQAFISSSSHSSFKAEVEKLDRWNSDLSLPAPTSMPPPLSGSLLGFCRYDMGTVCIEYYQGDAEALQAACQALPMPGFWMSGSHCPALNSLGSCQVSETITYSYPLGPNNSPSLSAEQAVQEECTQEDGFYLAP